MSNQLYSGIPTKRDYEELIKSGKYLDLDTFSGHFLEKNRISLAGYASKWVSNPVRQWSRKWEYPYVFDQVSSVLQSKDNGVILDAGSGVSFFPYYILSKFPRASIHCADYDAKLSNLYRDIDKRLESNVEFRNVDLREMDYQSGMFDLIYCISVLEHTSSYAEIINGFHRLLPPGGKLVVTFDVSLDGKRDISFEKTDELLGTLASVFGMDKGSISELNPGPEILTTLVAKDLDPDCLPWKAPAWIYKLQSLLGGKRMVSWPPPLTVYCLSLTKRA